MATSTATEPESVKKTVCRSGGVSSTSRSARRTPGAWVSPPNMTSTRIVVRSGVSPRKVAGSWVRIAVVLIQLSPRNCRIASISGAAFN